ncbi:MAG: rRNA maturation RNase YbeY [Candidatus Falkowbacteria bacterium]
MKIEINNQVNAKIDLKLIKKVVTVFCRVYKINNKELSLAFVGDVEIKKLNQTYRGYNKITDVLSFEGDDENFGEIIIDYNQIKRQAADFKNSAEQELIFILVHGLLHLIGHDDKTEQGKEKMIKAGEEFIKNYL